MDKHNTILLWLRRMDRQGACSDLDFMNVYRIFHNGADAGRNECLWWAMRYKGRFTALYEQMMVDYAVQRFTK